MFTATFPNVASSPASNAFPNAQFTTRANPDTSFIVYSRFRELALALIDTNSQEIFYRVFHNAPESYNGEGLHEKFIYRGQSVLDISPRRLRCQRHGHLPVWPSALPKIL